MGCPFSIIAVAAGPGSVQALLAAPERAAPERAAPERAVSGLSVPGLPVPGLPVPERHRPGRISEHGISRLHILQDDTAQPQIGPVPDVHILCDADPRCQEHVLANHHIAYDAAVPADHGIIAYVGIVANG